MQKNTDGSKFTPAFTFSYMGGKSRKDLETIVSEYRKSGSATFVDPFCGSARVTVNILTHCPEQTGRLYLAEANKPLLKAAQSMFGDYEVVKAEYERLWGYEVTPDYWADIKRKASESAAHLVFYTQNNFGAKLSCGPNGYNNSYAKAGKVRLDKSYPLPDLRHMAATIRSYSDYSDAIVSASQHDPEAFVYLDPPYYKPGAKTTNSCYPNHDPADKSISIDSLRVALSVPGFQGTIMAHNFISDELDTDYRNMASEFDYSCSLGETEANKTMASFAKGEQTLKSGYWLFTKVDN